MLVSSAYGQEIIWTGNAANNDFFDENNWEDSTTNLAPDAGTIDASSPINVNLQLNNASAAVVANGVIDLGSGNLSVTNSTLEATAFSGGNVTLNTDNSFYYWNNTTTSWVNIVNAATAVERVNDLVDGKSDNDGSQDGSSLFLGVSAGANDDLSDNDNVGVGYFALRSNTTGYLNTAVGSHKQEK